MAWTMSLPGRPDHLAEYLRNSTRCGLSDERRESRKEVTLEENGQNSSFDRRKMVSEIARLGRKIWKRAVKYVAGHGR